ncbi:hypothetical protein PGT21_006025 [Puccinia graminis f. sp. tritici]|uniref:Uncharacterized protein n=1 Tax=Puccinia graminis f. sp. tritici TaxID=56615 RepID=A0A5B0Q5C2_PUCGR|nr:hypothetical protein PGT21_006025 [Puccinia graminis f. sp. tritici]
MAFVGLDSEGTFSDFMGASPVGLEHLSQRPYKRAHLPSSALPPISHHPSRTPRYLLSCCLDFYPISYNTQQNPFPDFHIPPSSIQTPHQASHHHRFIQALAELVHPNTYFPCTARLLREQFLVNI